MNGMGRIVAGVVILTAIAAFTGHLAGIAHAGLWAIGWVLFLCGSLSVIVSPIHFWVHYRLPPPPPRLKELPPPRVIETRESV